MHYLTISISICRVVMSALLVVLIVACGSSQTVLAGGDIIGSPIVQPVAPSSVPNCISGSVLVGFDVDSEGLIVNERIIESSPEGIFDSAALETVRRMQLLRASGEKGLSYRVRYPSRGKCEET